ncbi:MAG: sulfite exporter TauE/SafE family protein [Bacteroidota bacterium]
MNILAYVASALIGISLGLIGGGGSIMTVPVLVYLVGTSPLLATSYSLFIVGSTSLVGAVDNYRKGLVDIKTALLFGLSSITTVFLTRKFIIPAIPRHLARIGGFDLTANILTMVLFAVLMIAAATAMIRSNTSNEAKVIKPEKKPDLLWLMIYGVAIGLATGVLGAGGGFLLIPTLVLIVGLPVKKAIGTSLLIIALNSLIGFTGDLGHFAINWLLLAKITFTAITGVFIGGVLGKHINAGSIKKGFGWFVLVMGVYIIIKELHNQ